MNLVIVESPAKAKTITKYLNANKALAHLGTFQVMSSMGHIRDLKKKELGIDIEHDFQPTYDINEDKLKTVVELRAATKAAKAVWLASDFDREGESIAMHLREVLRPKVYKRITFTEITPKALEHAVLHPRAIDEDLVDAQETRRLLDRLVGFKLSPLLWKSFKTGGTGLSAGRVQSAVLHLLLEREKEIADFTNGQYWHYLGDFQLQLGKGSAKPEDLSEVHLYEGATIAKDPQLATARQLLAKLKHTFTIAEVKSRLSRKSPDHPFITSTLQQEAYNKLGLSLKFTMGLAQELYEKGHITYMRTDSYNIAQDFRKAASDYVLATYGEAYAAGPEGAASTQKKSKNAQEAHEAIRPTRPDVRAADLGTGVSAEAKKLYDMIWKRTVAYFMKPCIYDELDMKITDPGLPTARFFKATLSKVKFNGFMILYGIANEKYDFQAYTQAIQGRQYKLTADKITAKNTWSAPPARYNDSSIIRTLEKEGIGRPSTYASIMNKLFEKSYVVKTNVNGLEKEAVHLVSTGPGPSHLKEEKTKVMVGQEQNKLVPTAIGVEVDAFLSKHFPYIVNKTFTANMEADLDAIAEADKTRLQVLRAFWTPFSKDLAKVPLPARGEGKQELKTASKVIRLANMDYTVRFARYGPVIEYVDAEKSKKYINLKPFLKLVKKELMDIDEHDVKLLTKTPMALGKLQNQTVQLAYGPYGFYLKVAENNVRLPFKTVKSFLETGTVSMKEVEAAVAAREEYMTSAKDNKKKVAPPPAKKIVPKKKPPPPQ